MDIIVRYVIQREDGMVYWKYSNKSSLWGLYKDFNEAYLFKSEYHAKTRMKSLGLQNCRVRKVEFKLIEE